MKILCFILFSFLITLKVYSQFNIFENLGRPIYGYNVYPKIDKKTLGKNKVKKIIKINYPKNKSNNTNKIYLFDKKGNILKDDNITYYYDKNKLIQENTVYDFDNSIVVNLYVENLNINKDSLLILINKLNKYPKRDLRVYYEKDFIYGIKIIEDSIVSECNLILDTLEDNHIQYRLMENNIFLRKYYREIDKLENVVTNYYFNINNDSDEEDEKEVFINDTIRYTIEEGIIKRYFYNKNKLVMCCEAGYNIEDSIIDVSLVCFVYDKKGRFVEISYDYIPEHTSIYKYKNNGLLKYEENYQGEKLIKYKYKYWTFLRIPKFI